MAGRFRPRRRGLAALSSLAGLVAVAWLAPMPWLADQWPRVLAVGLFLVVFVVPRLVVPARSAGSLAGVEDPAARGRLEDDRLKLQNEVRAGLLQGIAGAAVIAAVVVSWQQLEADRRQLRQQQEAAAATQAADRFARALDQLGSEQLDVRLGGIYSLEGIAAGASEQERLQVFEILSAYIRTTSHRPPVGPATSPADLRVSQADVSAAITVLARRTVLAGDPPLDLGGALLPGARLGWARLAEADLRGADLTGSGLQYAELAGVHLERSRLCGVQLQGADLRGAHLAEASASADTRWPDGFDWRAAGARLVDAC